MLSEKVGSYRITGKLGKGGMGEVFSAFDEKLNRTVALKRIAGSLLENEKARRLFLAEARAAAALAHPFICTVHEVIEHDGVPLIVMECVTGETLHARLLRGPLPVEEISHHTIEIAEALAAAHARGIVHRDIKSANIMLTSNGHVKVMDFGLAMMTALLPADETARRSEQDAVRIAGTLPYMAPEVLRGDEATSACDLYALGVVMYEMATGRRPFAGRTDALLTSEILNRDPTPPRQLNAAVVPPLDELIVRLLDKDPWRRPAPAEIISKLQSLSDRRQRSAERSLAVLPFRPLTPDAQNAHLGVALADATIAELALVRSLLVRPTAAILRYDGDFDPVAAGRELDVDAIVFGTYQRSEKRLRVMVQLISVTEQRPLWSTKVDTTMDDLFAMQDEVSRRIVEALQLELTPADAERAGKRVRQAPGDVVDLCLKGRVALLHESVADVNAGIELFERARDLDPENPLPWVGLSDAYSRLAFSWAPEGDWYERAKEMCDRALQLDPHIPEGHYLRGRLAWTPQGGFDHEYALAEMVAAIAERPNLNEALDWLATILFHVGLLDEGLESYGRALRIFPDDPYAKTHIPTILALKGEYRAALDRALETRASVNSSWLSYTIVIAEAHLGDLTAAERSLDVSARSFPSTVTFHSLGAVLAALKNDETAARRAIERTIAQRKPYGHFHHAEFDIACALAILGRADESIEWLERAVRNGYPCLAAVADEPWLAPIRAHPRYLHLLGEVRASRDHYAKVFSGLRKTALSA